MMNNKEKINQNSKIYQLYLEGKSYKQIARSLGLEEKTVKPLVLKEKQKDPLYQKFHYDKNDEINYKAVFEEVEKNEEAYFRHLPYFLQARYQTYKKVKMILKEYVLNKETVSFAFLCKKYELTFPVVLKVLDGNHSFLKADMFLTVEEIKTIQENVIQKKKDRRNNLERCSKLFITRTDEEIRIFKDFQENIEFWIQLILEYRLDLESLKTLVNFKYGSKLLNDIDIFKGGFYSDPIYFLLSCQFKSTRIKENDLASAKRVLESKSKNVLLQSFLLKDAYALHLMKKSTPLSLLEEQMVFRYKLKYVSFDLTNEADLKLIKKFGDKYLMRSLKNWQMNGQEIKNYYGAKAEYMSDLKRKRTKKKENKNGTN